MCSQHLCIHCGERPAGAQGTAMCHRCLRRRRWQYFCEINELGRVHPEAMASVGSADEEARDA